MYHLKILCGLFVLVILSKDCNQPPPQFSKELQDHMTIIYEASTRGFYEKTWVSKDSVSFSTDRDLSTVMVSKCEREDWITLDTLLKEINLQELPELEAPSKKYQVDGAAMATLTIEQNNETFQTKIFDHGNPPKAIAKLVNKVLSMKEIMAKH